MRLGIVDSLPPGLRISSFVRRNTRSAAQRRDPPAHRGSQHTIFLHFFRMTVIVYFVILAYVIWQAVHRHHDATAPDERHDHN